jgi:hypothetical protein
MLQALRRRMPHVASADIQLGLGNTYTIIIMSAPSIDSACSFGSARRTLRLAPEDGIGSL